MANFSFNRYAPPQSPTSPQPQPTDSRFRRGPTISPPIKKSLERSMDAFFQRNPEPTFKDLADCIHEITGIKPEIEDTEETQIDKEKLNTIKEYITTFSNGADRTKHQDGVSLQTIVKNLYDCSKTLRGLAYAKTPETPQGRYFG